MANDNVKNVDTKSSINLGDLTASNTVNGNGISKIKPNDNSLDSYQSSDNNALEMNFDEYYDETKGISQEEYISRVKNTDKILDERKKQYEDMADLFKDKADAIYDIQSIYSNYLLDYDENMQYMFNNELIYILKDGKFNEEYINKNRDWLSKYGWDHLNISFIEKNYDLNNEADQKKLLKTLMDIGYNQDDYKEPQKIIKEQLGKVISSDLIPDRVTNDDLQSIKIQMESYEGLFSSQAYEAKCDKQLFKYTELMELQTFKDQEEGLNQKIENAKGNLNILNQEGYEDYLKIYNYIKNNGTDKDLAGYIESLKNVFNKYNGMKKAQDRISGLMLDENGKLSPDALAAAINGLENLDYGLFDGMYDWFEGIPKIFMDGEVTEQDYMVMFYLQYLQENSKIQDNIYQTSQGAGMMIPPMVLGAMVGRADAGILSGISTETASSALIGISSFGTVKNQKLYEGCRADMAMIYAALAAGSDAYLEYKLGGIAGIGENAAAGTMSSSFKEFATSYIKSMGQEGIEEIIQDTVKTTLIDTIVLQEELDVEKMLKEYPDTFIQAALVAGLLNGGSIVVKANGNKHNIDVTQLYKILNEGGTDGATNFIYSQIGSDSTSNQTEVEKINVNDLEMSSGYALKKELNINDIYKGFDTLYKSNNNLQTIIDTINSNNNTDENILIEINNTTELTQDLIEQLPSNVKVRVIGAYTVDNMNSFKNPSSGLSSAVNAIYTPSQLSEIMGEINKIEAGMDSNLTDVEKIRYFYDYLVNNVEYNPNPSDRSQKYESLVGLTDKLSTCQGFAYIFQELCARNGIECFEVYGNIKDSRVKHAFNVVNLDGEYYLVDTVREALNGKDGFLIKDVDDYIIRSNEYQNKLSDKVIKTSLSSSFNSNNLDDTNMDDYISSIEDKYNITMDLDLVTKLTQRVNDGDLTEQQANQIALLSGLIHNYNKRIKFNLGIETDNNELLNEIANLTNQIGEETINKAIEYDDTIKNFIKTPSSIDISDTSLLEKYDITLDLSLNAYLIDCINQGTLTQKQAEQVSILNSLINAYNKSQSNWNSKKLDHEIMDYISNMDKSSLSVASLNPNVNKYLFGSLADIDDNALYDKMLNAALDGYGSKNDNNSLQSIIVANLYRDRLSKDTAQKLLVLEFSQLFGKDKMNNILYGKYMEEFANKYNIDYKKFVNDTTNLFISLSYGYDYAKTRILDFIGDIDYKGKFNDRVYIGLDNYMTSNGALGYYSPANDEVVVSPYLNQPITTLIHELLHQISVDRSNNNVESIGVNFPGYQYSFNNGFNETLTEFFTQLIVNEGYEIRGFDSSGCGYKDAVEQLRVMIDAEIFTVDDLKKAYFGNDPSIAFQTIYDISNGKIDSSKLMKAFDDAISRDPKTRKIGLKEIKKYTAQLVWYKKNRR